MTAVIGSIVRERAQSESALVEVGGVLEQRFHKIAAAHVVDEIAKKPVAKGIVAHVLQNTSAVGVGMCFLQVLFRGAREALLQKRLNLVLPLQVDDLLVGQYRI